MIALISAYGLYIKSTLQNYESAVIFEADKVNFVFFPRSCYFPEGFGTWAENVNRAIEMNREKISVPRAPEPSKSVLAPPLSHEDIYWLGQYLICLSVSSWPTDPGADTYSLGNDKFVPRDPANRGEEILRVLNLLGVSYLFPLPPQESPRLYSTKAGRRILFGNRKDVKSWLDDVEKFLEITNNLRWLEPFFPMAPFIDALKKRDQELIKAWEASFITRSFGRLEPGYLIDEFFHVAQEIGKIAEDTQHKLAQLENMSKGFPPQSAILVLLVLCGVLFVCGVICPLLFHTAPKFLYLHVPIFAYLAIYAVVIVWLCP